MEAIETYCVYPNIWNRINKKSLFNMEQIKQKIKKTIFELVKKCQPNEEKILDSSRSQGLITLKTMKTASDDALSIITVEEKKRLSKNSENIKANKTHKKGENINYNNLTMEIIEEKNEIKEEEKSNKEENKSKVNEVNERERTV